VTTDNSMEARNKQIVHGGFDKWRDGTGGLFEPQTA